ncbi:MAG: SIMPL domain-containing protein [Gemmatimonadaceae bacterium]
MSQELSQAGSSQSLRFGTATVPAVILAIGVALAGLLVGQGFARGRAADRYVSVKGVAEREVKADLAIWPLRVVGADNDLTAANAKLAASIAGVRQFLIRHGIDTSQVQLSGFSVNDAQANEYGSNNKPANRYVIHETMLIRSTHPDQVLAASQQIGELAAVGVVISSGSNEGGNNNGPTFVFSGLNTLKPAMIADATARAREGAEQFARDSRSSLGGIRQASQGVFEILPRDQAPGISEESQIAKIVRVVSTIDYYLK